MIEEILTGKHGFRIHSRLFRKPVLILQVEIHRKGRYFTPDDPTDLTGLPVDNKFFRDSTIQELYIITKNGDI
jgi:uncharacterized protein